MGLQAFLATSLVLFALGLYAVIGRRHLIGILIGVELMLNAASLNFMAFGRFVVSDPTTAQIIVLFIIGLAAAEAAIALSIVLAIYRQRRSIDVTDLEQLKG
ncbi:MAG: NADH-quinone oxidoreductase subunit NuoK [Deltaproteobacteria bacterium]|nr:NADH-quinone oxidoreductase subunit NuoK [Deltaproteobacteria bacterium]